MKIDITNPEYVCKHTREIPRDDIKWLWHSQYYDGPCSGMMEIKSTGQHVWANWIGEHDWVEQVGPGPDDIERYVARIYALFELTPEQYTSEEYWNWLFRLMVGKHWDYDEDGKPTEGPQVKNEAMRKFYYGRRKKDYKELDLEKARLIGWTVW